ncbi:MAG: rod shape-determining protein MreD [Phycisphaerae bacterium]|nr:rod shape-determining protein MreD [Phycisphaerae bacterium]
MRWVGFGIFAYLFVMVQMTLGNILTLDRLAMGPVGPDFLVIFALFIAFNARDVIDAMLAGWVLGMLIDLTTGGGGSCVGPMAILYSFVTWGAFSIREGIYSERALTQVIVAGLFCIITHGLWITIQSLVAFKLSWGGYGAMLLQVFFSGLYTAVLTPMVYFGLMLFRSYLIDSLPQRGGGRSRR